MQQEIIKSPYITYNLDNNGTTLAPFPHMKIWGDTHIIPQNDLTLKQVQVKSPIGEINVDTGNPYMDFTLTILGIGFLLTAMFIYGKYIKKKT